MGTRRMAQPRAQVLPAGNALPGLAVEQRLNVPPPTLQVLRLGRRPVGPLCLLYWGSPGGLQWRTRWRIVSQQLQPEVSHKA